MSYDLLVRLFQVTTKSYLPTKIVSIALVLCAMFGVSTRPATAGAFSPVIPGITAAAEVSMNPVLVDQSGPLLYRVTVAGQLMVGAQLTGGMTKGENGLFPLPWAYPEGGLEVAFVSDAQGIELGMIFLQYANEDILPSPPIWSDDEVIPGAPTPFGVGLSEETPPLLDPQLCLTEEIGGELWSEVPVKAIGFDGQVPAGLKVHVRLPSGTVAMTKGKRKTFRANQAGKSCSVLKDGIVTPRPREYCLTVENVIGPVMGQSAAVGLSGGGGGVSLGGSVTVSWIHLPYKRVSRCDLYRCENGVLVLDGYRICTRNGSHGWNFAPAIAGGEFLQLLLGYDMDGWRWEATAKCREGR